MPSDLMIAFAFQKNMYTKTMLMKKMIPILCFLKLRYEAPEILYPAVMNKNSYFYGIGTVQTSDPH